MDILPTEAQVVRRLPRVFARRRFRVMRREARRLLAKSRGEGLTREEKSRVRELLPHLFPRGAHTAPLCCLNENGEVIIHWYRFYGKRRRII